MFSVVPPAKVPGIRATISAITPVSSSVSRSAVSSQVSPPLRAALGERPNVAVVAPSRLTKQDAAVRIDRMKPEERATRDAAAAAVTGR
jgi:hypothetical protein